MCKDAEVNIITSKAQILERWFAHFDALLNRNFNNRLSNVCTEKNNEDFKPTKDEIEAVIDKLKNKAPGIDHIQADLLKHGGQNLILFLQKLLDVVWIMEKMPDEWETDICPLYKKGDPLHFASYRGIILLNTNYIRYFFKFYI
jgi:hypothetical protein